MGDGSNTNASKANASRVIGSDGTEFRTTTDETLNQILSDRVTVDGVQKTTDFTWSDLVPNGGDKHLLNKITWKNANSNTGSVDYTYDKFYRPVKNTIKDPTGKKNILTTEFEYAAGFDPTLETISNEYTTGRVSAVSNSYGLDRQTLSYTYDANGNIETVSEDVPDQGGPELVPYTGAWQIGSINTTTGANTTTATRMRTVSYLEVPATDQINLVMKQSGYVFASVHFYDANKTWLSNKATGKGANISVAFPPKAAYFKVVGAKTDDTANIAAADLTKVKMSHTDPTWAPFFNQMTRYYYDGLNQLIREDNAWLDKTIVYEYDLGGNIQSVSEYELDGDALENGVEWTGASPVPTPNTALMITDSYLYENADWKDQLTSFNGQNITYDAIGNPLQYYNGLRFEWQNGRQLAGVSGPDLETSYKYNSGGIRTEKTVNGVTTKYTLQGSNVVREQTGQDIIWYLYDANGVCGIEYQGGTYWYVKNLQGDITGIVDGSGSLVVSYVYDSWGGLVEVTGSMSQTLGQENGFRYRSYYYDSEIEMYYVKSRFYDPIIKRFINADTLVQTGTGVLGCNMYAYCGNNPVVRHDPNGHLPSDVPPSVQKAYEEGCRKNATALRRLANAKRRAELAANTPGLLIVAERGGCDPVTMDDGKTYEDMFYVYVDGELVGSYIGKITSDGVGNDSPYGGKIPEIANGTYCLERLPSKDRNAPGYRVYTSPDDHYVDGYRDGERTHDLSGIEIHEGKGSNGCMQVYDIVGFMDATGGGQGKHPNGVPSGTLVVM